MKFDTTEINHTGREVLELEAATINNLANNLNQSFVKACEQLFACQGHIIVIGMGKSGHIANKVAATLASTGSPAFFVHPGEAGHGDLGMITARDVVMAISNSGNTAEITAIIPLLKRLQIPLIAITNNADSPIAQQATVHINTHVVREACPLGLAPTSSTTAALALGDALAIALLKMRGFSQDDFALSHPGGTLGKRLLLTISDLMRTGSNIPKIAPGASLAEALMEMSSKRMGMTTICNDDNVLLGIYTDGDLRRTLDKQLDIHQTTIDSVMTSNCKTISSDMLAFEALQLLEQFEITSLVVTDTNQKIVGVVHLHDILKAGVI